MTNYCRKILSGLALLGLVGIVVPQYVQAESKTKTPNRAKYLFSAAECSNNDSDPFFRQRNRSGQEIRTGPFPVEKTCLLNLDDFIREYDGMIASGHRGQNGPKDGKVTPLEYGSSFLRYMEPLHAQNPNIAKEVIREHNQSLIPYLDINKDGVVSKADDYNKDNKITLEDLQIYRSKEQQKKEKLKITEVK